MQVVIALEVNSTREENPLAKSTPRKMRWNKNRSSGAFDCYDRLDFERNGMFSFRVFQFLLEEVVQLR